MVDASTPRSLAISLYNSLPSLQNSFRVYSIAIYLRQRFPIEPGGILNERYFGSRRAIEDNVQPVGFTEALGRFVFVSGKRDLTNGSSFFYLDEASLDCSLCCLGDRSTRDQIKATSVALYIFDLAASRFLKGNSRLDCDSFDGSES
jgi:hypothetical protein